MNKKTRKRIWPVPVVMSIAIVGALAAFLVLASNPGDAQAHGEWVEGEDHCPRIADEIAHDEGTFDHTCDTGPSNGNGNGNGNGNDQSSTGITLARETLSATVKGCTIDADDGNRLYMGSQCSTSDDMLDVVFENSASEDLEIVVYITGGSEIPGVQAMGKKGLDQKILIIDKQSGRVSRTPGSEKITVNSAMRDSQGAVYLYAHTEAAEGIPIKRDATAYPANPQFGVKVQFLGSPALGVDGDDADTVVSGAEVRSKLDAHVGAAFNASATPIVMVVDGGTSAELSVAEDEKNVQIRATVKDAGGNLLEDQEVMMTLSGMPEGIVRALPADEDTEADGTADFEVDVPGTDAFRITANLTVGVLELGSILMTRAGALDMVSAESCAMVMTGETDTKMDGCMTGYNPKMIYGPKDKFSIYAMVKDSLGSKVTGANIMVKPAEMAGYGDATMAFNIAASGNTLTNGTAMLTVKDKAPGARYLLDVVATTGSGDKKITKTDQVMIIVSDKVAKYEVSPEEAFVQRRRSQEFTVTAVDKNGNPPIFATVNNVLQNKVKVIVDYGIVRGAKYDPDTNELTLDKNTGMGTFTFVMPRDAEDGEIFPVIVGEGDMQVEVMITVGMEPDPMTVPGMPMNVSAMADGHDMIKVSWAAPSDDGNSAITSYIIERRYMGDMAGDIPSDGYNAAAGGASFAFSNHMEWWETLNCKGMLAAAGSDEDPMGSGPDKMMYCAHYASTAPTNMGGTIMAGGATDMAIQALFDKRYVVGIDAMTMMYTDMGLMPETEYTYRVSAVNAIGRSAWSAAVMATTEAAPLIELQAPTNLSTGLNTGGTIIVRWDAAAGAEGYVVIAININDPEGDQVSDPVNDPEDTSHALGGLTSGETYNIYVASFDSEDNELSESVMITAN